MEIVGLKWAKIAWHEAFNLVASIPRSGTGTMAFFHSTILRLQFCSDQETAGWDFPAIDLE